MEYKRFGSKIIVRIDKDEEILEKVKELALKENIRLAAVQALGATNSFTVGVYNVAEKKYYANTFSGSFEIVSLTGTINTMNGEFYTHLHMSAGNDKGKVFGVEVPNFADLVVTKTEPGFAGNTATNVTKPATLETGAIIKVPLFINEGEKIQVDTRTGEYLGRVKE